MQTNDLVWSDAAKLTGHDCTNIRAGGSETGIDQHLRHQAVPCLCDPGIGYAGLFGSIGESPTGKRRKDDIKGIGGIASETGWVSEPGEDVEGFDKRTGPSVGQNKWQGTRSLAPNVEEMDACVIDSYAKVGKGIEFLLLFSPVKRRLPVAHQFFHLGLIRASVPP